jgi:hypothetical protein
MAENQPRLVRQLSQIAAVLNLSPDALSSVSMDGATTPRSLSEDVLEITSLIAGLDDPALRRQCVALVESFVSFRRAKPIDGKGDGSHPS